MVAPHRWRVVAAADGGWTRAGRGADYAQSG